MVHLGLLFSLLAAGYWLLIASDRYVSIAHVVIQRTDSAVGSMPDISDFGALLSGGGGSGQVEQLMLRDHLLSVDMMIKLDQALSLRKHYSDPAHDILSRMWAEDIELELFHQYYLSRVEIEFNDKAGVLVIRAQAFDPEKAHAIASMLVDEGERYMNRLVHRLAEEQVRFLEKQVSDRAEAVTKARQAIARFQNEKGLVSPQDTLSSRAALINQLEGKLLELRAKRKALTGYLAPTAAAVVEVDLQIDALQEQVLKERKSLASNETDSLNEVVERYQLLQMQAEFVQDVYRAALASLEAGRVEATRILKKMSVLQQPTRPQYPLEPRRLYNSLVFFLVSMLVVGVLQLILSIIKDHRD